MPSIPTSPSAAPTSSFARKWSGSHAEVCSPEPGLTSRRSLTPMFPSHA
jgi:hypothetical protein